MFRLGLHKIVLTQPGPKADIALIPKTFLARVTDRRDGLPIRHMTVGNCGLTMSCSYLAVPFADCEPLGHIRPDNGPELTVLAVRTCSPGSAYKRFSSISAGPGRMAQ